jgi:hypothetical protein
VSHGAYDPSVSSSCSKGEAIFRLSVLGVPDDELGLTGDENIAKESILSPLCEDTVGPVRLEEEVDCLPTRGVGLVLSTALVSISERSTSLIRERFELALGLAS